jgi:hypothetical protein
VTADTARMDGETNARVPGFLRAVTIVECAVVLAAGVLLFFQPAAAKNMWPWIIAPFNSRYMGAVYFAALLPLVVFAWSGRWAPGRVVLWMIFIFTLAVGAAMIVYSDFFEWNRPATWIFWILYVFLPLNAAFFLYRQRRWRVAGSAKVGIRWRSLLLVLAAAMGGYGFALVIAPQTGTSFWPWVVDAFHGRIYAAAFLTPAVGALVVSAHSARSERIVVGLTLITGGLLSIVAVIWASATVPAARQVDFAALGTWAFFALNAVLALAGVALTAANARRPPV